MAPARLPILAGLVLVAAACGGTSSEATPAPLTTTTVPVATTTSIPATTTTTASSSGPTTTARPTSTTVPATTTTTRLAAPDAISATPSLPDGRPRTFLAVTNDFEAVEVDTQTGDVLRSIGQAGSRADLEAAEVAAAVNVIDAAWRTVDGSILVVSECCEPAAGAIHVLTGTEPWEFDAPTIPGWAAGASPATAEVAIVGYEIQVGRPDRWRYRDVVDPEIVGYASGSPTWGRDGTRVFWIAEVPTNTGVRWVLAELDLSTGEISDTVLDWVPEDARLAGLAARASGDLVTIVTTDAFTYTEGAVVSPVGALVERFEIGEGAVLGGYDPTGVFLIYVDGAGAVRWEGGGQAGTLADGFIFASW
ncbi:MAG: hypothetical protein EX267_04150 [Acidimicrobiia bacterium]|nr:MAG: hypothetical protein EX267_04150 [Acidimicrobiia bacterium]